MNRTNKRILLVYVLIFGFITIYLVGDYTGLWAIEGGNGGGGTSTLIFYTELPSNPVLSDIQPKTDTDGIISLDWSASSRVWYYNVYRRSLFELERKIRIAITSTSIIDSSEKENIIYQYRIEAVNNKGKVWSNKEFVTVEFSTEIFPTSPSIIINDGDTTTDSLEITLTLYCDNADEMRFKINDNIETIWTAYKTTYTITLSENDPGYPDFEIGVTFKNNYGMIEMIYDEIFYEESAVDPDILPQNPSISINEGAETTNSFEIELTLYCDNALRMHFQIRVGVWTDWIDYSTEHNLILDEECITPADTFRIEVVFENDDGTTYDAGYTGNNIVYDDITYEESAVDPDILPQNPSISINEGAETTNSFEAILTLSCENADEMKFKINAGAWTDLVVYSTTHTIILSENDLDYPEYRVEVIFSNEYGITNEIHDDITYDLEGEPPPPPPNGDVDYTMVYIIAGAIIGIIGIFAFIKYKKRIIKSN